MKELHSEIEITASAERTWLILTDFASYPRWNPFIRRISGEPTTGDTGGPRPATFLPLVALFAGTLAAGYAALRRAS